MALKLLRAASSTESSLGSCREVLLDSPGFLEGDSMQTFSYAARPGIKTQHGSAFASLIPAARSLLIALEIAGGVVSTVLIAAVWTFLTLISMGGAR